MVLLRLRNDSQKAHKGIGYSSAISFKDYISHNTKMRIQNKKDETQKNFYKLMNNSPYGKTIENVAKRVDIRILTSNEEERARKLSEKPHCTRFEIFDENLVGIEMRKQRVLINKPFYVNFPNNFKFKIDIFVNSLGSQFWNGANCTCIEHITNLRNILEIE